MPKHTFPVDGEAMPDATVFLAITPTMRLWLAATVENLIALLDEIDGDENLEEACEDEGAQCDDEGAYDGDCGAEDVPFDQEGCCHIMGGGSVSQAHDIYAAKFREERP